MVGARAGALLLEAFVELVEMCFEHLVINCYRFESSEVIAEINLTKKSENLDHVFEI